jgi:hypothetical protein
MAAMEIKIRGTTAIRVTMRRNKSTIMVMVKKKVTGRIDSCINTFRFCLLMILSRTAS